jgi:hypothetical protein
MKDVETAVGEYDPAARFPLCVKNFPEGFPRI